MENTQIKENTKLDVKDSIQTLNQKKSTKDLSNEEISNLQKVRCTISRNQSSKGKDYYFQLKAYFGPDSEIVKTVTLSETQYNMIVMFMGLDKKVNVHSIIARTRIFEGIRNDNSTWVKITLILVKGLAFDVWLKPDEITFYDFLKSQNRFGYLVAKKDKNGKIILDVNNRPLTELKIYDVLKSDEIYDTETNEEISFAWL